MSFCATVSHQSRSYLLLYGIHVWYVLVDGSEILRSPVEVGSDSPIIYRVLYISGGAGFLPSTVYLPTIGGYIHGKCTG